jgi:hypothetical protein
MQHAAVVSGLVPADSSSFRGAIPRRSAAQPVCGGGFDDTAALIMTF